MAISSVAAMLLSAAAFGHARLRSSDPANGARLTAAPASLALHFNEKVRLAALTLKAGDHDISVAVDHAAPATADPVIAIPALVPATYVVTWRALSGGDGHIMQGSFGFTILSAAKP